GRHLPDGDHRRPAVRRRRAGILARQPAPAQPGELTAGGTTAPQAHCHRDTTSGGRCPVTRSSRLLLEARRPRKAARPKGAGDKPSRDEAEEAVRTLLRWAGDNPEREGLVGTPDRVVRAYEEFFSGYDVDPVAFLTRTFSEVDGYDELIVLRDIRFES